MNHKITEEQILLNDILTAFSRYERNQRSMRVKRALAEKRARGLTTSKAL